MPSTIMNMTNTRVILLIIVHSVIHAALADDAEIVFNLYRKGFDDQCAAAYRPIALEDNGTSLRVYVNSSIDISSGFCYDKNGIKNQLIKTNKNKFLSEKQYVFKDMDLWTCYFYGTLPRKLTICKPILFHIRTITPAAQIYLNSLKVAAAPTSLNVSEYDAAATYYFGDDETVVIDCKRSQGLGYLKIAYNTDGILLGTKYSLRYIEDFHIKLTQKSHSKYVDCCYKKYIQTTSNSYYDISVTRIFFWSHSAGNSENNFASNYWIWIIGGVVMIVIINIVIVYIIKNFKNRRKMGQSNIDVVNSPNNGDSPLPHPRQWDEANNTKLIEPEMYSEPDHKNIIIMHKSRAKNIHNETSNNVSDSYYANVDTSRTAVMEPALIYADIFNANSGKIFEKDAAIYSQVRLTGTNIAGSNYENVSISPGPSYVNSHVGKDEIEPTYCEVQAQAQIGMR